MFKNEEEDKFFLKSFIKGEKKESMNKPKDFPLELFESTLKNLLDNYQVGEIESWKKNLEKMKNLSDTFQDIIYSIFTSRNLFLFLIDLMKTSDENIQANSLAISANLLQWHEDIVQLFIDNEVYQNIMDFLVSEYDPLVISVSILFNASIVTSENFLDIFIKEFLDGFIQIINESLKKDVDSVVFRNLCQVFYTVFLKIDDLNILEKIYQNILLEIYDRQFFIFFLQFIDAILNLESKKLEDDQMQNKNIDIFIKVFFDSDFPMKVLTIFNKFCATNDEDRVVGLKDINYCLSIISKLFEYNYLIYDIKEKDPNYFSETFCKNLNHLLMIDEYYNQYECKINNDQNDVDDFDKNIDISNDDVEDDLTLLSEIPINAVRVFISLVKILGPDGVTIVSNLRIISDFTDVPEDYPYSKRLILDELCLTVLEYCSDNQFYNYISPPNNPNFLVNILENVDCGNKDHISALNGMLDRVVNRNGFDYSQYLQYYDILHQIQEDNLFNETGSVLDMFLLQMEKYVENSSGLVDEGQPPSDD